MVTGLSRKLFGSAENPSTVGPQKTNGPTEENSVKKTNGPSEAGIQNLHQAENPDLEKQKIPDGDENQVIVFDLDETLIAGDKHPITKAREKKINAMGDREVQTIAKDNPSNTQKEEIKYVLRPGAKELLEYLTARNYKIIASTRNYSARAETICKIDPVLSKHISGSLGRSDLQSQANKDFKKYPNHPDKMSMAEKVKNFFYTVFIDTPRFTLNWLKAKFTGGNVRWTPRAGTLGKYPPNMIEMLKANGNHNFDNCKPARFLVDNSNRRELKDSLRSGDWTWVNPNVDHNGDGKRTSFFALDEVPQTQLTDKDTGETKKGYLWVKNVIDAVERGWREQYKFSTGKEPKTQ